MKYPNINDDDFNEKLNKIYKRFTIPKDHRTYDNICIPKKYQLQLPQLFVSEFINPKTPYKGILIYHRIGAGKTCTAIRVAEKWKKIRKIVVVLPASLKGNFRTELRSLCADNNYLKPHERKELSTLHPMDNRYIEIIAKSDERIDKYYTIYSYNKFVELVNNRDINLRNSLLIVDEVQNMVSEDGSFYNTLYDIIHDSPTNLRIVLLSATPMFDKPNEMALTLNLMRIPKELPIGRDFDKQFIKVSNRAGKTNYSVKNIDKFKEAIKGYVSYFRGAPALVFPEMRIKYVKCEMSDFQYSAYRSVLRNEENMNGMPKKKTEDVKVSDLPNNFFIGTRLVSNIVFPNKKINETGYESFKGKYITEKLERYSTKFYNIMKRIERASGKVFVYSGFKEFGGLKSFAKVLDTLGYSNYAEHGEGWKRYAIWSGDENITYKDEVRTVYNMVENLNGSKIKILLITPSGKEGINLYGVRQAHIMEPYWNKQRLAQVIGRGSRFCSHKDLPEEKRNIKVYIYLSVHPDEPETIDQYINHLSQQKSKLIDVFETAIKEVAIDCKLNKNANIQDDGIIICDK